MPYDFCGTRLGEMSPRLTILHIFGMKDSPSIANFSLRKTAKDNAAFFSKEVVNSVEKDFYMLTTSLSHFHAISKQ